MCGCETNGSRGVGRDVNLRLASPPDGRKIPEEMECPVDNVNIKMCRAGFPLFRKFGFTPNTLTWLSFAFGLLACYMLTQKQYALTGIFLFIGYIFDCCDGNYARTYGMTTAFGDALDHATDFIVHGIILAILLMQGHTNFLVFYIVLLVLLLPQMFFQECVYAKPTATLTVYEDVRKKMGMSRETCKKGLKYSRYFGVGVVNLLIALAFIYLQFA